MTKHEIERLAVVETKIDDMVEDMSSLKEFLTEKVNAQKEAIGIAMVASKEAILKAEIANDLRFNGMDKRITDSVDAINKNIKTLTDNQNLVTGAKTGIADFKSWITWAILIAGFIITYFVGRGGV